MEISQDRRLPAQRPYDELVVRRVFRIIGRVAVIAVAVAVALAALILLTAAAAIHSDWGQRRLRALLHDEVAARTGLELTVDEVGVTLLPLRATVRGLSLDGRDGEPILEVASVGATVDAGALLRGDVVIERIDVERPRARLALGPGGAISNLPRLERPPSRGGEGRPLWVKAVRLRGGEVHVDAPGLVPRPDVPIVADLRGLDLRVAGPARGTYDVELGADGGAVVVGARRLELDELRATARLEPDQLLLRAVDLGLGGLRVRGHDGVLRLAAPFDARLETEVELPLSLVSSLPLGAPRLGGHLVLAARVAREGGEVEASGALAVAGAALSLAGAGASEPGPLGDLEAELRYARGRLEVPAARLELAGEAGGRVELRRASLGLTGPDGAASLPVHGELALAGVSLAGAVAALGLRDPGADLVAGGELAVRGRLRPLALRVELQPLEATGVRIAAGPGQARTLRRVELRGGLDLDTAAARAEGLEVALGPRAGAEAPREGLVIDGRFPFAAAAPLSATVRSGPGGLALDELAGLAGVALGGAAQVELEAAGTYAAPVAHGRVAVAGLAVAGRVIDAVDATLRYEGRVLEVPRLDARFGRSRVGVRHGRLELGGAAGLQARASASLEPVALGDAVALAGLGERLGPLRGLLEGRAELTLRRGLEGLTVALAGTVPELGWGDKRLGEAGLDVVYDRGAVEVRALRVRRGQGVLDLEGTVSAQRELDLTLDVAGYRVPPLAGLLPVPAGLRFRSTVDARVRLEGTVAAPLGHGEVALRDTSLSGRAYGLTHLRFEVDGAGLRLAGQVAGDLVRIDEARLALVSPWDFAIRGAVRVDDVAAAVPEGVVPEGVGGRLASELELRGALGDASRLAGAVTIGELEVEARGVRARATRPLELRLEGGEARAEGAELALTAAGAPPGEPGATVRLPGLRLGLASPWPVRLRAVARLEDLGRLAGAERAPDGLRARAELLLGVAGDLGRLDRLRGRATVRDLAVRQGELELRTAAPLQLALAGERLQLEPAQILVSTPELEAPRTLSLGGWISEAAMDVGVEGSLELAMLAPLIEPVQELTGLLTVSARVTGSPASPQIAGRAAVANARAVIPGLPGIVDRGRAEVRFSRDVAILDRLEAGVLGGRAVASGRASLSGLGLGSYHVDARLLGGRYPFGARSAATFDAVLAVDGPSTGQTLPIVSGRVDVLSLRYVERVPLELDVFLVADRVLRTERAEARVFEPEGGRVRLDVRVAERGRLRLDTNLGQATVHIADGNLLVTGTDQALGVVGTVRVEPGAIVTFRNTQFEVQRGQVDLRSHSEIDGTIDVEATTERRDWNITLRATGPLRQPEIQLTSDPMLSEADILLVLTVGMTQAEFQEAGASAALSELVAQGLVQELGQLPSYVGRISVATEYSPRLGRAIPRVRVNRDLTSRLELGGSVGLSASRDFDVDLSYRIVEGLSIDAIYSSEAGTDASFGDVGIDLRYRRELGR